MFNNGSNGLGIGWKFNFKPFLGVKFFLLLHHYQKLLKTMFGKFLPRLFLKFFSFPSFYDRFSCQFSWVSWITHYQFFCRELRLMCWLCGKDTWLPCRWSKYETRRGHALFYYCKSIRLRMSSNCRPLDQKSDALSTWPWSLKETRIQNLWSSS